MAEPVAFVPVPEAGRTYTGRRRVRWGDVDRHGRLRLDALPRHLLDVLGRRPPEDLSAARPTPERSTRWS